MPETLYIKLDAVGVRPLEDGLLAFFNTESSDERRYFELVSLRVSPAAPTSNITPGIGDAGSMSIQRISSLSGGDAATVVKMDSGDASLPSQVSVVNDPDSVTLGDVFRRIADAPAFFLDRATSSFSGRTYGGSMTTHQKSHMADIWRGGESADVEPIILREGEGIAMVQDSYGTQHAMQTAAVVTNTATWETYIFRSADLTTGRRLNEASFAIFNGSGSGVVLAVKLWVLPMEGEAVMIPPLRLCRIAGLALEGNTVTPLRPDTSKSVPSALSIKSGPFQPVIEGEWEADYYSTHGTAYSSSPTAMAVWNKTQIDAGTFSRQVMTQNFRAIGETPDGIRVGTLKDDMMFDAQPGKGILIKPGDGLALVAGRDVISGGTQAVGSNSTFINFDIEATILHYPPPAAPAGGNTYSRSRVVNR